MGVVGRMLDASVVASFDGSGFRRHARGFDPRDLEVDLTGRRILVTGASGGLGLATARALAQRGAAVLVGSRSAARAHAACAAIEASVETPVSLEPAVFDVSSVAGSQAWAAAGTPDRLDGLIHNAGVLPKTRSVTDEGHEQTVATNLIGPFALTMALLPQLRRSDDARVIWVSSGGMLTQKLHVGDTFAPPEPFDGVVAYARTKRAEVVLARALQAALGPDIAVYSMHPGWAATPGVEHSLPRFFQLMQRRLRTPAEGADTTVWLAAKTPRPAQGGAFWFDRAVAKVHPLPGTRCTDAEEARLWARLVDIVGLPLPHPSARPGQQAPS